MNLIIDIGNSYSKIALFRGESIFHLSSIKSNDFKLLINEIKKIKNKYSEINKVIISSVSSEHIEIDNFLKEKFKVYIKLSHKTKIPIKNLYKTKETLGKDRLAAIIGANNIYPNNNVLVFDAGTALTIDFINNKNEYLGGGISPGIKMRFNALNYFTKKLPNLNLDNEFCSDFGTSTESSIKSGVQNGILNEIEGYILKYSKKYKELKIIFTGGDTFFFDKRLTNEILSDPNLVLKGLNIILKYNE